jgi:hypothetical protein
VIIQRGIAEKWIRDVLQNPTSHRAVGADEVHFFGVVEEAEGRCLKVVVNPGKGLIVTVYFDRNMRKRGCK